jgi:hypothetical protein
VKDESGDLLADSPQHFEWVGSQHAMKLDKRERWMCPKHKGKLNRENVEQTL